MATAASDPRRALHPDRAGGTRAEQVTIPGTDQQVGTTTAAIGGLAVTALLLLLLLRGGERRGVEIRDL